MLTYQDYEKAVASGNKLDFIMQAIQEHKSSKDYLTAVTADTYDQEKNKTINEYVKMMFTLTGMKVKDFTASNAKLASNFFNRLSTQKCTYSLGNGVSFTKHIEKKIDKDGTEISVDTTKEKLGDKFDTVLKNIGYFGIIHGLSFGFVNIDKVHLFKLTECVPLWDEYTGALRIGIRFWQLDTDKPMIVELYEEDGVTKYRENKDTGKLEETAKKTAYKITTRKAPIDTEATIVGEDNYNGKLPIVPFWGSRLHQSILIGKQQTIDSFDLINSGFANDLTDCSEIYWLLENCGGMSDAELQQVRDRMKLTHMLPADTSNGGKITPFVQEIPYQARKERLDSLRAQIYEDFACLDVHTIAAGATNDHIDAGYQPVDDAADDFEYQVIEFVQQVLALMGIDDTPVFKRNKISNQKDQTEMVLMAAQYLDDETVLSKLPFITPDEVPGIMARRDTANENRFEPDEEVVI